MEGYATLDEAADETLTRFDPWGNEIEPNVIAEAVAYTRELPKFVALYLGEIARQLDEKGADHIAHLPDNQYLDRVVDRIEADTHKTMRLLEQAAVLASTPLK